MKICSVFKSSRKDEMYLYVEKRDKLERVPDELLEMFGKPVHVMDLMIRAEKPLARVDGAKVLEDIDSKGFYLQMPPPKDDYLLNLHQDRPVSGVR